MLPDLLHIGSIFYFISPIPTPAVFVVNGYCAKYGLRVVMT